MSETIGFIGLGIMGRGMVQNLLDKGHVVYIWNRTASRMEPFIANGAVPTRTPRDLARHSDIIITCVSDTADVEQVILGDAGVIEGAKEGSLVVDMSTISPQTHARDCQCAG